MAEPQPPPQPPPPADPPADPLGRRRCPKCLYDRFGLEERQACPECGYLLPAGVIVLTLPRVSRSLVVTIAMSAFAKYYFWAYFGDVPFGIPFFAMTLSVLLCIALVEGIRRLRIAWNSDAHVSQLWLTPDGIGFERDADRYTPARTFVKFATTWLRSYRPQSSFGSADTAKVV